MVKVVASLSFDCKIYVDDVISSWDETDAACDEEDKPLQSGVWDENHYDAC